MTLSEYMKHQRLDDSQMAEALGGCSSFAVKKWRYRERMPRRDQMRRIAEVTGGQVTANDFLSEPAGATG